MHSNLIFKIKTHSTCFTGLMSEPIHEVNGSAVYFNLLKSQYKCHDKLPALLLNPFLTWAHLFSSSDISACSLRCHFSAWLNTCLSRRTLVCTALMSSDSTSPLTTAHRPSNISVTSSRVYVSSTSLCNKDSSIN